MSGLREVFLYVAAIAAASAAFATVTTWHWHVCDKCQHRWGHAAVWASGNVRAHTCGRCGEKQWLVAVEAHRHLSSVP